ncbi:hydrophobin-263 [Gymnopilus junonius]|uniref:Hydrophobin n=1 Tax=Gymnopilus junonius TaxID=109634 RepID=A0A9P5NED7_GYMJU|nr:hydrophobin-263 [Gymnopilus junonius]KAF8882624.1 hydrophobin-263 [Gymnopilus junonius]
MRFARAASVFVLALPVFTTASVIPRNDGDQCDTGSIQCCTSVTQSTSETANLLAGLLDIVLDAVDGLIGFGCSPITIVGASGTSCNQQPVCCTNDAFNGLINIGCTPITIVL